MIILGIVLIMFLGWYVLKLIGTNGLNSLETISISYGIGIGSLTFIMFYMSLLGFNLSVANIFLVVIGVLLSMFLLNKKILSELLYLPKSFDFNKIKTLWNSLKIVESALFAAIAFFAVSSLVISSYWPVTSWDSLTLYDFRAKLFASSISVFDIVKATDYAPYYFVYPFLTSLAHAFIYMLKCSNPQFMYSFYYIGLLLIFFSLIRNYCSRVRALFFTLLLALLDPLFAHSTTAYTNFPYTFYYVASTFYLIRWIQTKENNMAIISSVLLAFSYWTRSIEPFWIANLLVLFWFTIKNKRILALIISIAIFFFVKGSWQMYFDKMVVKIIGIDLLANSVMEPAIKELLLAVSFERVFMTLKFVEMNIIKSWGYIFTLFIVMLFLNLIIKSRRRDFYPLFVILFLNLLFIIVGTYYMSVRYQWWTEIPGSASRMAMFFPPLFLFYISILSVGIIKDLNIRVFLLDTWQYIYDNTETVKKIIKKII